MKRKILVADLLCGAGGSSTGAAQALVELGLDMELVCVNHWNVAIETHKANHPHARHYCQDISTVRPHLVVPEGYLDLLMASPTCTHHSVARGGKPTSDQQRSDPWHIITWLTELRVKRIMIENVWEFVKWGPVDPRSGKPIKSRQGEYFNAWIETMRRLDFELEWRKLNAADYGEATTRQRFFLLGRSDRKRIAWPSPTHTKRQPEAPAGLHPWRPAREIIDWNIKGRSIFTRKKPLAPKTLARIYAGAVNLQWPEPFLVILRNHMGAQSVDAPLPTVAANGTHIGLAQPVVMNGRKGSKAKGVETAPIPTLDTKGGVWLAEPALIATAHGNAATEKNPNKRRAKGVSEPLGAIHASGGNFAVAEPLILSQQASGRPRSAEEPLPTILTGGAGTAERPGCARHAVVQPFVLSRLGNGAPRPTDQPTPTQVATHSHVLIAPYYSSGSGETCKSADVPLSSLTTKARFGMVIPVTHSGDESNRSRDVETDGLPTVTGANRGELAFITAAFGEREGQAPRVHDLGEPAPTICATGGSVNLVEPTESYDILFRMLEPHELAAAMGFNDEDATYAFSGNKTEQIKQIGNAVSVRQSKALVKAMLADSAEPSKAERAA